MMTCKIKPITLECAIRSGGQVDDPNLVLNHMIAIAQTPLSDYFYNMGDDLERLARLCSMDPCDLAAKSYGEVANLIVSLCGDAVASKENESFLLEHSIGSYGIMRAFIKPLFHASLVAYERRAPLERHQWREVDCTARCPAEEKTRISLGDTMAPDYFQGHFIGHKGCFSPEVWLADAFSFRAKNYCEAVSNVLGGCDSLKTSLSRLGILPDEVFDEKPFGALYMLYRVSAACGDKVEDILTWRLTNAYDAMYLLLIVPYALIYKEHKPLERYVASTHHESKCQAL